METLTVGDKVSWKGSWGNDLEQVACVTGIQLNERNGSKEGEQVSSVKWDQVTDRNVILDLDNSHWCWAFQVNKL